VGPSPPRLKARLRRSQRVVLSIPITVSAETAALGMLEEDTHTLVINANGALIAMEAELLPGQQLQIKNRLTSEQQLCHVIHVGPKVEGKIQMGIEFTQPAPRFWHMTFPPEDWSGIPSE